jgi:hypothetical protein
MGIDLGRFKSKKNEEWLDWLADDPVPAGLRARMRAKAVQEASRPVVRRPGQPTVPPAHEPLQKATNTPNTPGISIHIALPKLKKPTLSKKLPKLPKNLTYKKAGIGASALVLVVAVGVIALQTRDSKGEKTGNTGVLGTASQKPTFEYSLPTGAGHEVKAESVRYDAQRKVVNFTDSIGGVTITISQQPLPDKFKENTDEEVKKLAESFSANEVLSTANPTAYLGTSAKGPQTVIFSKKGLLVFIQSTKEIDNHDWAEYITNLQ